MTQSSDVLLKIIPSEPVDVVEEAEKQHLLTGRAKAASVDEQHASTDASSDDWQVWSF